MMAYNVYLNTKKFVLNPVKKVDSSVDKPIGLQSPGKTRYVLRGGMIQVYKTDKNGQEKCVGSIPLRAASMQILNQVEVTDLSDALLLLEVKREKMGKPDNSGTYNKKGQTETEETSGDTSTEGTSATVSIE